MFWSYKVLSIFSSILLLRALLVGCFSSRTDCTQLEDRRESPIDAGIDMHGYLLRLWLTHAESEMPYRCLPAILGLGPIIFMEISVGVPPATSIEAT